jgi:glycosyltransferase involved in cell wall biosynthesis
MPGARLLLAGPNPTAAVQALAASDIAVTGFAEDLPQLLSSSRLLLAPQVAGSGVRIKVLTALAHGLPVVANRLGLQGITTTAPAVSCAESPEELAAHCLRLLQHPDQAATAGRAARELAETHLSPGHVARLQVEHCDAAQGARR